MVMAKTKNPKIGAATPNFSKPISHERVLSLTDMHRIRIESYVILI